MRTGSPCGAKLKTSAFGLCEHAAHEEYGGRCFQHRVLSDSERAAMKVERATKFAADEAAADLRAARSCFVSCALLFGLDDDQTRSAFREFSELNKKAGLS